MHVHMARQSRAETKNKEHLQRLRTRTQNPIVSTTRSCQAVAASGRDESSRRPSQNALFMLINA